CWQGTHFPWTF
nr:immunoglobulin light chain junction region [Mus musculus]NSL97029.1 immunoglobulin light chain junction region [Mus musculus]NSL97080.1 immunoglobulin light chain junction region [Mus musculus]NSL97118.1 immunoglobulin light chain junction region [Mus musculus]NSL97159.1 immunoglobulin light chain junction region [Mus musculus]